MVKSHFFKEKKLLVTRYIGPINDRDLDTIEMILRELVSTEGATPFRSLADFTTARVVNRDLVNKFAALTNEFGRYYEHIYVTGMSPFIKILYRYYLKMTGKGSLHTVLDESFEDACKHLDVSFNIADEQ